MTVSMLVVIHWLCGMSAAGLFGYLAYSLIVVSLGKMVFALMLFLSSGPACSFKKTSQSSSKADELEHAGSLN